MSTRPFIRPKFATNLNYAGAGAPYNGTPTKQIPSSGRLADGFVPEGGAPAQEFNWLIGNNSEWSNFLGVAQALNWHDPTRKDAAGGAIATGAVGRAVPWPHQSSVGELWIAPEGLTNGAAYFQIDGEAVLTNTSAAFKHHFGVYTAARAILFNGELFAGAPRYVRSNASDPTAWTPATLPVSPAGTYAVTDAIVHSGGNIVVIGRSTAPSVVQYAWTSTDQGATWTQHTVTVSTASGALQRIAEGKNGLLIGLFNGADDIAYSSDAGVTWTLRTALDTASGTPFLSAHYLPGQGTWLLFQGGKYFTTDDVIAGTIVSWVFPGVVDSISDGDLVYVVVSATGGAVLIAIPNLADLGFSIHSIRGTHRRLSGPNPQGQILQVSSDNIRRSFKGP